MKSLIGSPTLGLALLMAIGASAGGQAASSSPEDSVRGAEYARRTALLNADTVLLSRLTATEFREINRLGLPRTRKDNMQEIASHALRLLTVRFDSLDVRIYGDVAVLTGIADNTGEFRGTPFSGKIRYTRIFVRRSGRWQAILMQHTPMPEDPS